MNVPTLSHSRILIVGASGSGKSHFAERLAQRTRIPFVPTDGLYWTRDWALMSDVDVISRINFSDEAWIIDGNFDSRWQEIWPLADLVVWLNPPIHRVLFRVLCRNMKWALTSSDWNGERMPLDIAFGGVSHSYRAHSKKQYVYPERIRHLGDTSFVECNSDADADELIRMF